MISSALQESRTWMPIIQFKGKAAIESYHHTVPHHSLEFDGVASVLGKGEKPSLEGSLIVEGDNLQQPVFKEWMGRVVGKEGEDATRHDKWCGMIYPRVQLLRELLSDDGVLFASIDDNEVQSLRLILDEAFRVEKPLATLVWKRRSPTGMRKDPVSVDHEYVLLYAKDSSKVKLSGLVRTEADYPYEDDRGKYASTDLTIGMTAEDRPNQFYTIENPRSKVKYEGTRTGYGALSRKQCVAL
jgi:adenine-specific DNA-methyltransferase